MRVTLLLLAAVSAAAPTLERGDGLYDQGQIDEAERVFRQLLNKEPGRPDLHFRLGRIHVRRGESAQARQAFQSALSADPKMWRAALELARLETEHGQYGAAQEAADACLAAAPAQPDCLEMQGLVLHAQQRAGESVGVWLRLVKLRPEDVNARINLARAYREAGKNDEAAAAVASALKIDPNHALAHYLRAEMLVEQGDIPNAMQELRRALASRPELTQAELLLRQLKSVSPPEE